MSVIVLLHGASSSGKTTLAKALQAQAPAPFLRLSFDTYRDGGALPPPDRRDWPQIRAAVFEGLHRSLAGFADSGCNLIVEHILDTPGWRRRLQTLLCAHQVLFVGLFTPTDLLARRERARGDRRIGSAAEDAARIHAGLRYDLTLDGTAAPETNARHVLGALAEPCAARSAFFTG
ncbi:chloramphenicol phosphotransferase CPT family protein [Salipiger sp. P9]|uniref:chloramphenicol phosphotransferase CPT family protein n=1 Tax=Salipiger pentaromativorans TaxID=2943193 RepID=UPI0021582543|nr:chloramphenicol phosphotransferase CPT family protein [Salipiger pentaromativorans]MCR8549411.1 chloramphenicol phosphotransferase CPT family protein [Salipiger pentaromativorans]